MNERKRHWKPVLGPGGFIELERTDLPPRPLAPEHVHWPAHPIRSGPMIPPEMAPSTEWRERGWRLQWRWPFLAHIVRNRPGHPGTTQGDRSMSDRESLERILRMEAEVSAAPVASLAALKRIEACLIEMRDLLRSHNERCAAERGDAE